MKKTLLSILLFTVGILANAQTYVNASATGANNGTTWADAYTDLHDALFNTTTGEIWVAQGTYVPSKSFTGNIPGNNSQKTFRVKFNVQVYGGFNGTETLLSQRDWNANQTIVSGLVATGVKAFNVVRFDANDNTTVFDGFIIENGFANGTTELHGGAMYMANNSNPTIKNCLFRNNSAQQHGGAVFASGGTPNFYNCIFKNNSTAQYDAGALYITAATGSNIANCLFESNVAARYAGAVVIQNTNTTYISNCTFVKNQRGLGDGKSVFLSVTTGSPQLIISNSIFYGNLPSSATEVSKNGSTGGYHVKNCFSINGATDYAFSASQTNVLSGNPFFVDFANGDYNLECRSTCVNSGDATGLTIPTTDLNNNPRTIGSSIDLGAFENSITNIGIEANKTTICAGDFVVLRGTCDQSGYNWDNGVTDGIAFYPTATTTYTCTGIGTSTSEQITIEVLNITDENVSAPATVCSGSQATVNLANSLSGATYFLRDNTTNFIVDGPIAGTGSALNFTSNTINSATTYNVYAAQNPSTLGHALDFDGLDDYVSADPSFDYSQGFTIEGWFNGPASNSTEYHTLFTLGTPARSDFEAYTQINSNQFTVLNGRTSSAVVGYNNYPALPANQWVHVACIYTPGPSGGMNVRYNGILQTPLTSNSFGQITKSANSKLIIGDNRNSIISNLQLNYKGKIDEVQFWNAPRSQSQIMSDKSTCLSGNEAGLKSYYNFEEGTGTVATDLASGYNGTLTLMDPNTDWVTNNSVGCSLKINEAANVGKALDFDGSNDLVGTTFKLPSTSTFSIESWVYPRSTNYDRLISNYSSSINGSILIDTYNATDNGRGIRFNIYGAGNALFSVGAANVLTLNSWNHVACTFENGLLIIYVNGFEVVNGSAPFTSIPQISSNFVFGEDNVIGTAEYFNGKMDDVRFWNKALSQSEIMAGMSNCLTGTEANLLAYYNFENGTGTIVSDLTYNQNDGTMYNMDGSTDWVDGQFSCSVSCTQTMSQTVTVSPINIDNTTNVSGTTITSNQAGATYRWLDCNNSYALIGGETSQTYTAITNGSYAVEITSSTCTDTSACVNMTTVGIEQVNKTNMSIFPNPVNNVLHINTDEKIKKVSIYNINGSLISNFENVSNDVDVSNLKNGMYILVVQSDKGVTQNKFIKE